jgi:hypothetical protein
MRWWQHHAHSSAPRSTLRAARAMAQDRPAWVGLDDAPLVARGAPSGAMTDMHGDGGSVNDHLRRELAARGGESTTLRITGAAAASVDAYIEYQRIVGNADGGTMFTGAHAPRAAAPCAPHDREGDADCVRSRTLSTQTRSTRASAPPRRRSAAPTGCTWRGATARAWTARCALRVRAWHQPCVCDNKRAAVKQGLL